MISKRNKRYLRKINKRCLKENNRFFLEQNLEQMGAALLGSELEKDLEVEGKSATISLE